MSKLFRANRCFLITLTTICLFTVHMYVGLTNAKSKFLFAGVVKNLFKFFEWSFGKNQAKISKNVLFDIRPHRLRNFAPFSLQPIGRMDILKYVHGEKVVVDHTQRFSAAENFSPSENNRKRTFLKGDACSKGKWYFITKYRAQKLRVVNRCYVSGEVTKIVSHDNVQFFFRKFLAQFRLKFVQKK